jgi:hypothetical protein
MVYPRCGHDLLDAALSVKQGLHVAQRVAMQRFESVP